VPSNSSVVVVEVPQLSDLSVGCLTHRVWDRGSRPASIKMDCHGLPTRRVGSAAMAGFIGHPKISQGFSDYLWIRGGVSLLWLNESFFQGDRWFVSNLFHLWNQICGTFWDRLAGVLYDRGCPVCKVNNSDFSFPFISADQLPIQVLQNGLGDTMDVRAVQVGKLWEAAAAWDILGSTWWLGYQGDQPWTVNIRLASQVTAAECILYHALMLR